MSRGKWGISEWTPRALRKKVTYILKIPNNSTKHREMRALLNGQKVQVTKFIGKFRRHGMYMVKLVNSKGFPKTMPKEFKMWGPYICCSCTGPASAGCTCGGY